MNKLKTRKPNMLWHWPALHIKRKKKKKKKKKPYVDERRKIKILYL